MPTILIADDDRGINDGLAERLTARDYSVVQAFSGREALHAIRRDRPDVVLLDHQMPEGDGFFVLSQIDPAEVTVVMITAYGTIDLAVDAMKRGAYDFITKPFEPALIEQTIRRALERSALCRTNRAAAAGATQPVASSDPKMQKLYATAKKAAAAGSTVLILGESGVGKEVLAREIHRQSPRAAGPLVAMNCTAVAETLLESELFGHEAGSFTGAIGQRAGKIELAHGGTLFLDEIGDISPAFQAKLLRVLQEHTFERVGGTETLKVDVRFVAATNKDLREEVAAGRFREDLYYRLNVIALTIPPLRERSKEDIDALVSFFLNGRAASADARAVLRTWHWPGNVRELRNVIERAVVLADDPEIGVADLPPELADSYDGPFASSAESSDGGGDAASFHAQVESHRKRVIEEALAAADGNQTRAAAALGLQRTYLARLIKKFAIGR
jgi:DNA-binding NtrC family response regulator